MVEVLSFTDQRSPQFVLGTGGTLLAGKIKTDLTGETIAGLPGGVSSLRPPLRLRNLEPRGTASAWAATFRDTSSAKLFGCKIGDGQIACD